MESTPRSLWHVINTHYTNGVLDELQCLAKSGPAYDLDISFWYLSVGEVIEKLEAGDTFRLYSPESKVEGPDLKVIEIKTTVDLERLPRYALKGGAATVPVNSP